MSSKNAAVVTIPKQSELKRLQSDFLLTDFALATGCFPTNQFTDEQGEERFLGETWLLGIKDGTKMETYHQSNYFRTGSQTLLRDFSEPGIAVMPRFQNVARTGFGTCKMGQTEVLTIDQQIVYYPRTKLATPIDEKTIDENARIGEYTLPNGTVVPCYRWQGQNVAQINFRNLDQKCWYLCEPVKAIYNRRDDSIQCCEMMFAAKILNHPRTSFTAEATDDQNLFHLSKYLNHQFLYDLAQSTHLNLNFEQQKLRHLKSGFKHDLVLEP